MFTEDDYNTLTGFVNFVARNAEFRVDVTKNIQLYKYLNNIQTTILPKVQDSILEVKSVKQVENKQDV